MESKVTETARFERLEARKRRMTESITAMDETVMDEAALVTPGKASALDSGHESYNTLFALVVFA